MPEHTIFESEGFPDKARPARAASAYRIMAVINIFPAEIINI
jgi:hypothetical protein